MMVKKQKIWAIQRNNLADLTDKKLGIGDAYSKDGLLLVHSTDLGEFNQCVKGIAVYFERETAIEEIEHSYSDEEEKVVCVGTITLDFNFSTGKKK